MPLNEGIVSISGHLVEDPILRTTKAGREVVNIRIASTSQRYNQESGWQEKGTFFVNATAWNTQAKNIAESLVRGDRVVIAGKIEPTEWEKDGQKHLGWKINIDEIGASLAFSTLKINRSKGTWNGPTSQEETDRSIEEFMPKSDSWAADVTLDDPPF